MEKIDRAKVLHAASALLEHGIEEATEKLEEKIRELDEQLEDVRMRTTVATLVPLINQIEGMEVVEEKGELCVEFNGKKYPIRGPKGDQGEEGPVGPRGERGERGFIGNPGEPGKISAEVKKSFMNEVKEMIPTGNIEPPKEGMSDKEKEAFDKALWKLKQEFEGFRLDVDKNISSRMTMLAMLAQGGGGGGGEVKLKRLDDVDAGQLPDGGILEWDTSVEKFVLAAHLRSQNVTPSGGAISVDYKNGAWINVDLTENVSSFTATNWPETGTVGRLTVVINQNGGGNSFNAWPAGTIWPDGTAPTTSPDDGDKDVIVLTSIDGGSTIIGTLVGTNYI